LPKQEKAVWRIVPDTIPIRDLVRSVDRPTGIASATLIERQRFDTVAGSKRLNDFLALQIDDRDRAIAMIGNQRLAAIGGVRNSKRLRANLQ
jgi:hypothetical protein